MPEAPAFIIETADSAVGVVVRQDDGYRFFAAHATALPLDGRIFKSPAHAEREARRLAASTAGIRTAGTRTAGTRTAAKT